MKNFTNAGTAKKRTSKKLKEASTQDDKLKYKQPSSYEKRRQELLNMFPSMLNKSVVSVNVESAELLPKGCTPHKEIYEISKDVLDYYSLYVNDAEEEQYGNFHDKRKRGNESWHDRNHWKQRGGNQSWRQNNSEWNNDNNRMRKGRRMNDDNWNSSNTNRDRRWDTFDDRRLRQAGVSGNFDREGYSSFSGRRQRDWQQHDDRWSESYQDRQNDGRMYSDHIDDDYDGSRGGPRRSRCDERLSQSSRSFQADRCPSSYEESHENDRFARSPSRHEGNGKKTSDDTETEAINYNKMPDWKTRRRKFQRYQRASYPSCLVKVG